MKAITNKTEKSIDATTNESLIIASPETKETLTISDKEKQRGLINTFFKDCSNEQEQRKKLNILFNSLSSETKIKLMKKRNGQIESLKVANEFFINQVNFVSAFQILKQFILKDAKQGTDKTVNVALSENLGLISQFRIIKDATTNEQFKKFLLSEFEDKKAHFKIYGFMDFLQLVNQIKETGKFPINFVKDAKEEKIKDSLSYKLFKKAHQSSITNKEDFKIQLQRGEKLNKLFLEHKKESKVNEIFEFILSNCVKINDLKESALRTIYNLSFENYVKFELNKTYPTFTEQFEQETIFNQLESSLKTTLKAKCITYGLKDTKVNALKFYKEIEEQETELV